MHSLLDTQSYYSLAWGTASPGDIFICAEELGYTSVAITDNASLASLPAISRLGSPVKPIFGASFDIGAARLIVLIRNQTGYSNLCQAITGWHTITGTVTSATAWDCFASHLEGLVFITDDRVLLEQLSAKGASCYYRLGQSMSRIPDWAKTLSPIFAPQTWMLHDGEYQTHLLLRAIQQKQIYTPSSSPPPGGVMLPPEEYTEHYAVFTEALQNADTIAEELDFSPSPTVIFPPSPSPDSPREELRELSYKGAEDRYGSISESISSRLEYELGIIAEKGFTEYFLVVNDIVAASPRTCGRGSGAASLVNYCLGITNVDPLRHRLMFERFLNPGRTDPPDIDIDFAWDERDKVLEYVFSRYGRDRAAMVANHLTFQPRMAFRETARAFGMSDAEISGKRDKEAEPWKTISSTSERLFNIPRALSLHCGGVVITPDAIASHVPVQMSAKGWPMIQWEKDGTEEMGLVKIDLLGNRSLAVIRDASADITARGDAPFTVNPEEDPLTEETIATGNTIGVFYVESPATRLLQQKAGKGDFEHLVIHSSIIRPAANDYINEYVARLRGKAWQPMHPLLAGVLDETLGIPVYQEDVSKIAIALAGFDHIEADALRKCLGKRDAKERLEKKKHAFVDGCRQRGVDNRVIDEAWRQLLSMTGYSFCKPHSASYARVSFEAASLKTHHSADFMAAVLSNGGGYYSVQAYISEVMRMGIRLLCPDVNRSRLTYREENGAIRIGLMAIRELRQKSIESIVTAREQNPFADLNDFINRGCHNPVDLRYLTLAGALDSLAPGLNRPQILWLTNTLSTSAQTSLFAPPPPEPPHLPPLTAAARQEYEHSILGFLTNDHPLSLYEKQLRCWHKQTISSEQLKDNVGRKVKLIAWPVTAKIVTTRDHKPMEFYSFEDRDGIYETVLFPEIFQRYAPMLTRERPYLLTGLVTEEWGAITVQVTDVEQE